MKRLKPAWIIVLLAITSLLTAGLTVLYVLSPGTPDAAPTDPLFEQGIAMTGFTLTERSGQSVSDRQLLGKVWIADFIFTRCPGVCPIMTQHMSDLQARLRTHPRWRDMRLVSISVDPEHDTPEQLRQFADRFDADPVQWLFLTGDREDIWQLCREGFKQSVEFSQKEAGTPILHSTHFVLVDEQGRIRGFYNSLKREERDELCRDLEKLLGKRV